MKDIKLLWELYKMKNNTKKTSAQMKQLQERKLREMLTYAYDNSPYYRRAFEQAGITSDNIKDMPLAKFPSINKNQLIDNFDTLVTSRDVRQDELHRFDSDESAGDRLYNGKYHVVHSSGSTGTPRYFIYDENAWNTMLVGIIRAALWNMSMVKILSLLMKGPRIVYIAATDGRYGGAMAVGDGIDGVGASKLYLDIKMPLNEWIDKINDFKPNMIIGYPSAIKILGELVERQDTDLSASLNIFRIVSCGEPLGASLRRYLEEVFDTEVINFYGASESLSLGVETDPEEGMLLFDDMNVIEAIDGKTYLTSLYNFTQPLIRYCLTDSLELQPPSDDAEYPYTRAVGLLGRNEDIMWFEDADGNREFLHPLAVEGICIEGLRDYQFLQTGNASFEIFAEISDAASAPLQSSIRASIAAQVRKILVQKGLPYVACAVSIVDKILPDPETGKKRLIIRDEKREKHENSVDCDNGVNGKQDNRLEAAI